MTYSLNMIMLKIRQSRPTRIWSTIPIGILIFVHTLLIGCKGTSAPNEILSYKRNIKVTFVLDTDLLEDKHVDYSTLVLESTFYNPEKLPDGWGNLYETDLALLYKTDRSTYQGSIPHGNMQVLIQPNSLSQKHRATVWINNYGMIPTGDNITIEGAYDIEVKANVMHYKIR